VKRVYLRAATFLASALHTYLQFIGSTLQVRILLPDGKIGSDAHEATALFMDVRDSQGPMVLPLWTSDQINLLAIAFRSRNLRDVASRLKFFVDDSFGGIVMESALKRLQLSTISISDHDPAARLRSLRSFIRSNQTAFLVVDGRGPYFHVGSGIVNLAHSTNATVVPCAASASAALTLRGRSAAVAVPLPRSRVVVAFGEPRLFGIRKKEVTSNEEAARLETELVSLGARALTLAASL
jgi:lysophospholipid acyltransferase (LPLAT)-like uncharacterized protein